MQNLRDKLLKAGLVTAEQANKAPSAENERPKNTAPRPRIRPVSSPPRPVSPPRETAIPKLPPLPGSKAHQRIEAIKQRELDRKLLELVRSGEVLLEPGLQTFYFVTRKGKLRRLNISEAQAKLLEEGKLAVVERQEPAQIEHSLVPPEVAEKMYALFPKSVRFHNKAGAPVGFLSDEELKNRQTAEAAEPPESESESNSEPESQPNAGETWITIKRAPPTDSTP